MGKKCEFEALLGSVFISITVILVIVNVFLRYFIGVQFSWIEEVSVGCFIWAVYLGATAGYRSKSLIGVDALTKILPLQGKKILRLMTDVLLVILTGTMFYLSFKYTIGSDKITSALEVSYVYINSSLLVSFGLMTFYSIYFLLYDVINYKKLEEKDLDQSIIEEVI